jgi:hypothetical protein
MCKKKVYYTLAGLAVAASITMYMVGSNSGHLTELKDFFWAPLPLALAFFLLGNKTPGRDKPKVLDKNS